MYILLALRNKEGVFSQSGHPLNYFMLTTFCCEECKKKFISKSISRKYCSKSCASKNGNFSSGVGHANYRGKEVGYWGKRRRFQRLFRKKDNCYFCNINETIIRHHIDADIDNNTKDNLLFLCKSCHSRIHQLLKKWKMVKII